MSEEEILKKIYKIEHILYDLFSELSESARSIETVSHAAYLIREVNPERYDVIMRHIIKVIIGADPSSLRESWMFKEPKD